MEELRSGALSSLDDIASLDYGRYEASSGAAPDKRCVTSTRRLGA
jgi:hypothetical protein